MLLRGNAKGRFGNEWMKGQNRIPWAVAYPYPVSVFHVWACGDCEWMNDGVEGNIPGKGSDPVRVWWWLKTGRSALFTLFLPGIGLWRTLCCTTHNHQGRVTTSSCRIRCKLHFPFAGCLLRRIGRFAECNGRMRWADGRLNECAKKALLKPEELWVCGNCCLNWYFVHLEITISNRLPSLN